MIRRINKGRKQRESIQSFAIPLNIEIFSMKDFVHILLQQGKHSIIMVFRLLMSGDISFLSVFSKFKVQSLSIIKKINFKNIKYFVKEFYKEDLPNSDRVDLALVKGIKISEPFNLNETYNIRDSFFSIIKVIYNVSKKIWKSILIWLKDSIISLKSLSIKGISCWMRKLSYEWRTAVIFVIISFAAIGGLAGYNIISATINIVTAYRVELYGENLGVVQTKNDTITAVEELEEFFKKEHNMIAVISEYMKFTEIKIDRQQIIALEDFIGNLKESDNIKVSAVSISVNGEKVAAVSDKKSALKIIDMIKQPFVEIINDVKSELVSVSIIDDIKILETDEFYEDIGDVESVWKKLSIGSDELKEYIVVDGDSLWSIARNNNMTVDDLRKANTRLMSSDSIKQGDKLSLVVPKYLINVETVERLEYVDKIPYEVEYRYTKTMYKNQSKVINSGEEGKREVVAELVRINGMETETKILSEKIIKQPVLRIISQGTKELPPKLGTGTLGLPVRGTISSRFGNRWGRFHQGVDIAASTGTSIFAADSGVVTFAGWNGGYGRMVEINHGRGLRTIYAHCNSIKVSVGQNVKKGQVIATVGSSGNSTGPHVHFEVRKNGVAVNPLSNTSY